MPNECILSILKRLNEVKPSFHIPRSTFGIRFFGGFLSDQTGRNGGQLLG
jgi:hypothetical protein